MFWRSQLQAPVSVDYSAVGLKTVSFPLAGTTVFKQSPL